MSNAQLVGWFVATAVLVGAAFWMGYTAAARNAARHFDDATRDLRERAGRYINDVKASAAESVRQAQECSIAKGFDSYRLWQHVVRLWDERDAALARVASLEQQASATIHRAFAGEGEPGRYSSVLEMWADLTRKELAEVEAERDAAVARCKELEAKVADLESTMRPRDTWSDIRKFYEDDTPAQPEKGE
jgi:hypothetical protein